MSSNMVSLCLLNVLEIETATTLSDAGWTKTCSWSVGRACIEWSSNECDVVLYIIGLQAWAVLDAAEGGYTREDRVGLPCISS